VSWFAFKLFVKKSWLWLKTYWYFPLVIIYTLVMWLVFRKNGLAAFGALEIKSDSYKEQIKVLNNVHEAEKKEKEQLSKVFNETIEKVEIELKKKSENLDRDKKKRVKEIVEKHSDDPERLAQLVKESFGFEIVE
tara:strand:- start:7068 stop:7472 length:405 start_codon:yes stop_codon:yes gene_type:complete